jgi:hypothetical protein
MVINVIIYYNYKMTSKSHNVTCCICEKNVNKDNTFAPLQCLNKYGRATHRVCSECWWDKFAIEDISHECPGCIKGLPLTRVEKEPPIVIDLTKE